MVLRRAGYIARRRLAAMYKHATPAQTINPVTGSGTVGTGLGPGMIELGFPRDGWGSRGGGAPGGRGSPGPGPPISRGGWLLGVAGCPGLLPAPAVMPPPCEPPSGNSSMPVMIPGNTGGLTMGIFRTVSDGVMDWNVSHAGGIANSLGWMGSPPGGIWFSATAEDGNADGGVDTEPGGLLEAGANSPGG